MRLAIALLLIGRMAVAQAVAPDALTGGISGQVITSAGRAPVEGAVVSLIEAKRSVTTTGSGSGAYQLLGVAPGTYTVSVRKIGFGPIDARITLQANQVVDADMELEIATVQREPSCWPARAAPPAS
jgi:hypothetical protein